MVNLSVGKVQPSDDPPKTYWAQLEKEESAKHVAELRRQFGQRVRKVDPGVFGPPLSAATKFLERVARDGWVERTSRRLFKLQKQSQ